MRSRGPHVLPSLYDSVLGPEFGPRLPWLVRREKPRRADEPLISQKFA